MKKEEEKLKSLDNEKLIDVVKNYRQYGYDENLRKIAISILNERGIDEKHLKLTGNYTNLTYDSALDEYNSFMQNSKKAFISFMLVILTKILISVFEYKSETLDLILLVIYILFAIFFIVFLLKSFINQSQFYKTIGKDYGTEGALIYFFLGMPFYFIMYFYFRNQMKEKLTTSRM